MKKSAPLFCLFAVLAVVALAQRRGGGGGGRGYGGGWGGGDPANGTWSEGGWIGPEVKTPREVDTHSTGSPNWTNPKGFEKDTFTFARVRRGSTPYGGRGN